MRAAIYARKSNDDDNKHADLKSVSRQVEHARAYAERKGWTVAEEHVFTDDGISGAVFDEKRAGLLRLLNHAKEFDCIVMSELSRLGREQAKTAGVLAKLIGQGKRIFFYLTDKELQYESAVDKFMVAAVTFADEIERERASVRSRDALKQRAEKGYVSGGRVYGYRNVWVMKDGTRRVAPPGAKKPAEGVAYTDYERDEEQAEVVRAIFKAYADGHGLTKIAKALNGDKRYAALSRKYFDSRTPPSPWKGTGSWDPSSIRAMLYRERYTGKVPFGEFRKKAPGANNKRERQAQFLLVDRPELRIIPPDLWDRVQKRLKAARESYIRDTNGNWWGRPESGRESRYLLSGMARCEVCGHNIVALSGGSSRGQRFSYYLCAYHHNRGAEVCANDHKERIERLDSPVLAAITEQVLRPHSDYIAERALQFIAERRKQATPNLRGKLEAEIARIERELRNASKRLFGGDDAADWAGLPRTVRQEFEAREQRLELLRDELAAYTAPVSLSELDERRLRKGVREQVGRFQELLQSNVTVARQVLRKLLHGPIHFVPEVRDGRKSFRFYGETKLGPLLEPAFIQLASPRGFEPLLPP